MATQEQTPFLLDYLLDKYIEDVKEKYKKARGQDLSPQNLADLRRSAPVGKFIEFARLFFAETHVASVTSGPHGTGLQLSNLDHVSVEPPKDDYVEGAINTSGFVPITGVR